MISIEVAKADLEEALSSVRVALGTESDLSGHYLFRVLGTVVQIQTFSLRTFAASPLTCTINDAKVGDAFTVESWRLDQWLNGVGDGVITLSVSSPGEVTAKLAGSRTSIRLRSLDPARWPLNDSLMAHSTEVIRTDASDLAKAVTITRHFVSTEDTSHPKLCVIEIRDGCLLATDRKAFVVAKTPLTGLNVRLPGKDVPALVKFLSKKEQEITIKTAERPLAEGGGSNATFWRPDGAYFGMTRPATDNFPDINPDPHSQSPFAVTIDCEEFKSALAVLEAGAPKQHDSATFKFDPNEGPEGMTYVVMPCEAGGVDEYPLTKATVSEFELEDVPRLGANGTQMVVGGKPQTTSRRSGAAPKGSKWTREFTVNFRYVLEAISIFGLKTATFNGQDRGRNGVLDLRHVPSEDVPGSTDPNSYYMALLWKT